MSYTTEVHTVWERVTLTSSETSGIYEVGTAEDVEYHIRVHVAGSAGDIAMEHSAIKEPGSFSQLGTLRALNSAVSYAEGQDHFLPYVRFTTANVAGNPIISVYLVVKK